MQNRITGRIKSSQLFQTPRMGCPITMIKLMCNSLFLPPWLQAEIPSSEMEIYISHFDWSCQPLHAQWQMHCWAEVTTRASFFLLYQRVSDSAMCHHRGRAPGSKTSSAEMEKSQCWGPWQLLTPSIHSPVLQGRVPQSLQRLYVLLSFNVKPQQAEVDLSSFYVIQYIPSLWLYGTPPMIRHWNRLMRNGWGTCRV